VGANAHSKSLAPFHLAHSLPSSTEELALLGLEGESFRVLSDAFHVHEQGRSRTLTPVNRGSLPDLPTVNSIRGVELLIDLAGALHQIIQVEVLNTGTAVTADVLVTGHTPIPITIAPGESIIEVPVPAVASDTAVDIAVMVGSQKIAMASELLKPVRNWTVSLIHHSHIDIGFTHLQSEVEALQWEFFEEAIEAARDAEESPDGFKFVWNVEILWAVETYLEQATPAQRRSFIDAVERGWIGLDALHVNMLSGLCNEEELVRMTRLAQRLKRRYGFEIDTAMVSDIPGFTQGMVSVLADSGVKYWSIGTNTTFRIGNYFRSLADRPFYWQDASGERRVLSWIHGEGYEAYHLDVMRDGRILLNYLEKLANSDYPYEQAVLRYSVFDNGPPDPPSIEIVRAWNEKYVTPKIMFSSTRQAFQSFEAEYGDTLPVMSGDLTPYWEDGTASSAFETGMNRVSADRLIQAEKLWAMYNPGAYPVDRFWEAWSNVVLFDEHTWGAITSIALPESDFTLAQWEAKRKFAIDADVQSRQLVQDAIAPLTSIENVTHFVTIVNTSSWPKTDLVLIPADWTLPGDVVMAPDGSTVPSQRLSTGELAFLAEDVPPIGETTYSFHAGRATRFTGASAAGNSLSNDSISLQLNPTTAAIQSLNVSGIPVDLVENSDGFGINEFLHVDGRDPATPTKASASTVQIKETGPVVASLVATSSAPGTNGLQSEIRLVSGLDRIDITNTIDKQKISQAEAIHVAFPFNVQNGDVRIDTPWGMLEPDKNQFDGSNKNHFSINRWADVSNDTFGVTFASLDAPVVEIGEISSDPLIVGWKDEVGPSNALFSYVMNNYWEVNYKATQEGPTTFRYSILPHGPFDAAAASRFGIGRHQPFILIPVDAATVEEPPFEIDDQDVIVTAFKPSEDGNAWIIRLFGASGETRTINITAANDAELEIWTSNLMEEKLARVDGEILVPGYGMVTLFIPRDSGSGGGSCIIAMVADGTPLASELEVLRNVRDEFLLRNPLGLAVANSYYRWSASVVDVIRSDSTFRSVARAALVPTLFVSKFILNAPEFFAALSLFVFLVAVRNLRSRRA
jgi:hypothetical protein